MRRSRILILALLVAAVFGIGIALMVGAGPAKAPTRVVILLVAMGVAVAVAVAIAIIVTLAARSRRAKPNQASETELTAERLGFGYQAKAESGFHHDLGPLPGIPRGGHVAHVFRGTLDGRRLTIFEHKYVINTGQAVIPVHHTAYVTDAPQWPSVTISRRHLGNRILRRLGVRRGLELEDAHFNESMKIKTEDEDFSLTLLHPDMQKFITEKPGVTWRVHAGCCALIYSGRLRTDRMDASMDRLRRFWELVPEELMAW